MKVIQLLQAGALAVLLCGWGIPSSVQAAATPANFNETIGMGTGATDKYGLLCGPGNTGGRAIVNDLGNDNVHFHVCINNADGVPGQCQHGDGFGVVLPATALGGPGFYIVDVSKGPPGTVEAYIVTISCVGGFPGAVFLLQDQ
jgi:hypothetical protein